MFLEVLTPLCPAPIPIQLCGYPWLYIPWYSRDIPTKSLFFSWRTNGTWRPSSPQPSRGPWHPAPALAASHQHWSLDIKGALLSWWGYNDIYIYIHILYIIYIIYIHILYIYIIYIIIHIIYVYILYILSSLLVWLLHIYIHTEYNITCTLINIYIYIRVI